MSSPHSQLPHTFENILVGSALWMTGKHSPSDNTTFLPNSKLNNLLTVIQLWSVVYLWFFKLFLQMWVSICTGTQTPKALHSSDASKMLFITGSLTRFMVFTRKVQTLGLFWMSFTCKIIYVGFHHQTFRTQHIVSSFLEITEK